MSTPTNSILDTSLSVNDILRHHPEAVALLSSYRIDSCCRGHESLAAAASTLGLDPARIAEEIVAGAPPTMPQAASCSCGSGCGHSK